MLSRGHVCGRQPSNGRETVSGVGCSCLFLVCIVYFFVVCPTLFVQVGQGPLDFPLSPNPQGDGKIHHFVQIFNAACSDDFRQNICHFYWKLFFWNETRKLASGDLNHLEFDETFEAIGLPPLHCSGRSLAPICSCPTTNESTPSRCFHQECHWINLTGGVCGIPIQIPLASWRVLGNLTRPQLRYATSTLASMLLFERQKLRHADRRRMIVTQHKFELDGWILQQELYYIGRDFVRFSTLPIVFLWQYARLAFHGLIL